MASSYQRIIVTDPSYIRSAQEYEDNITSDQESQATFGSSGIGTYVSLPISQELYDTLPTGQLNSLQPSDESADEMFLTLGPKRPLSAYRYLGSHSTDSGLTCVIPFDPYHRRTSKTDAKAEEAIAPSDLELDWLELVTVSLEGGSIDLEEFPLLRFCAAVPDGESAVAVFGVPQPTDDKELPVYTSLVLRAWTKVFEANTDAINAT